MSDSQDYLNFAIHLAHQAGEIMLKHFTIGVEKQDKADGTPVTIADKAINHLVIKSIKENYPEHAIQGEEASYLKKGAEYVWVCDPIDGTIPYTFGTPISQFFLAVVKNGEPILGVLYDPYMKRLYHAVKGEGAFLNKQKIQVNSHTNLQTGKYLALPSQKTPLLDSGSLLHEANRRGLWSCNFLCFTYEAVMIATGQFVGNIFGYSSAHDVAAIKVIVEEAGGKVTDLLGKEQRYDQSINGAIVSNALVHDELVNLIKEYLIYD